MSDLHEQYIEQDARWNLPDESIEEFIARRRNERLRNIPASSGSHPLILTGDPQPFQDSQHQRQDRNNNNASIYVSTKRPSAALTRFEHEREDKRVKVQDHAGSVQASPVSEAVRPARPGNASNAHTTTPEYRSQTTEHGGVLSIALPGRVLTNTRDGGHPSDGNRKPDIEAGLSSSTEMVGSSHVEQNASESVRDRGLSLPVIDKFSTSSAPIIVPSSFQSILPTSGGDLLGTHREVQTSATGESAISRVSKHTTAEPRTSMSDRPLKIRPSRRGAAAAAQESGTEPIPATTPGSSFAKGASVQSHTPTASPMPILGSDDKTQSSNVTTPTSSAPTIADPPRLKGAHRVAIKTERKVVTPKKSGKKEAKVLLTPLEFALKLQEKMSEQNQTVTEASSGKPSPRRALQFLRGKRIFYVGGDNKWASVTTKGRMKLIVRHGGTLQAAYDPTTVTHIVTDTRPSRGVTLKALGLKKLSEIPDHVATVTWNWILEGHSRAEQWREEREQEKAKRRRKSDGETKGKNTKDKTKLAGDVVEELAEEEDWTGVMPYEFMHAAFSDRIDAGPPMHFAQSRKGKEKDTEGSSGKGKMREADALVVNSGNSSPISSFTPDQDRDLREEKTLVAVEKVAAGPPEKQLHLVTDKIATVPLEKEMRVVTEKVTTASSEMDQQLAPQDPLAEFYELVKGRSRAARNGGETSDSASEGEGSREGLAASSSAQRRWTCDPQKGPRKSAVNQDIIDKLEELMQLHKAKPSQEDQWRVYSYRKSIPAIRNYPKRIKSLEQAMSIRGVGKKTALKIMEILQTGDLRRVDYERTEDVEVTTLFQGIYGVGQKTAYMWYASGCRTLEDIRMGKGGVKLSHVQEIGLRYYDDINSRMPRAEAKAIFDLIKPIVVGIDPRLFVDIMGSYRRGKSDCGDIDILITRPTEDGKTHAGILFPLLKALRDADILTDDLTEPDDPSALEATYRGLCRLPNVVGAKRRRIDILTVPWETRGAALLYYTGDDIFNRAMRMKANVLGYSLNQRGLYAGVVRNPRNRTEKFNTGSIIASETEEEIFRILGVPWQEPHERVRG